MFHAAARGLFNQQEWSSANTTSCSIQNWGCYNIKNKTHLNTRLAIQIDPLVISTWLIRPKVHCVNHIDTDNQFAAQPRHADNRPTSACNIRRPQGIRNTYEKKRLLLSAEQSPSKSASLNKKYQGRWW